MPMRESHRTVRSHAQLTLSGRLRPVASLPIEEDDAGKECPMNIGHFTSVSFSTNALICSDGQGQNRTADTRIFSPRQSAPRSTQEHLKQRFRGNLPLGR